MNELFQKALYRKMNKLERKLEVYASMFFNKDVRIMYISKDKLENAKIKTDTEVV